MFWLLPLLLASTAAAGLCNRAGEEIIPANMPHMFSVKLINPETRYIHDGRWLYIHPTSPDTLDLTLGPDRISEISLDFTLVNGVLTIAPETTDSGFKPGYQAVIVGQVDPTDKTIGMHMTSSTSAEVDHPAIFGLYWGCETDSDTERLELRIKSRGNTEIGGSVVSRRKLDYDEIRWLPKEATANPDPHHPWVKLDMVVVPTRV